MWKLHDIENIMKKSNQTAPVQNSKSKKKREVRMDIKCRVSDVSIIGSGLCVIALSVGVVSFYNFATGDHIYDLNT